MRFDPADEQRLLLDARLYDAEALALIFDTYYDSIFRYIYVRVGHEQVSEDLAAQVFQRLLAHLREGRGPEQFLKAWLFRDDARRGVHRTHAPLDGASEIAVTNNEGDPLVLGQLRAALDQLPPAQRQAVTLRYLLEFSNEEIAQVMNLSVGAVKAHVHRGLTTLRGKLSEKSHE